MQKHLCCLSQRYALKKSLALNCVFSCFSVMLCSVQQVRSDPRLLSGPDCHFGVGLFPSQLRDESPFQRGGGELQTLTKISTIHCNVEMVE